LRGIAGKGRECTESARKTTRERGGIYITKRERQADRLCKREREGSERERESVCVCVRKRERKGE
jgi:hypothetical protein